uniref:hypothetical protein n=1 Tax=Pararhizobium sp. IMCC3301 TaxID=3067904 RepID=UPI002740E30A|nr:hypothetical protein [Pararhizobium sp. IMCC3301]
MLEADPKRGPDRPLDQQNDLLKFLVQVKTTEHATSTPRIKLSALKHLVDTDLPAAIAILFYAKGGRRSKRCLIVPVDEALIADTLRLVRAQEAKGNREIHKVKVPIPMERATAIGPDGEGLSSALHDIVSRSPNAYIAHKKRVRETCGFADELTIGRFFVPGENAHHKLGDLFLGGKRQLEINHLTIEQRRFGIPLNNDQFYLRDAILEMDAQALLSASIEIEAETGEWISIPVDVFIPPPFLADRETSKIRFANQYFEVVFDFQKEWAGVTFDYDGSRKVELEEAVSIYEIGAVLARPKKLLTVQFIDARMTLPIVEEQGPFKHWIPVAPMLRRICSALNRSTRRPQGTIRLETFNEWVETHFELLALGSTPDGNLNFSRWPEDGIVDEVGEILAPISVELMGIQYAALIELPIASVARDDKEIKIIAGQPSVVDDVVRAPGADTSDFIDLCVETFKRRKGIAGPVLICGGFEA